MKQSLPKQLPPGTVLFTMDVTALYSNIPVEEGICTVLRLLEDHEDDIDILGFGLNDIEHLLHFVLSNSYCRFGEDVYRQRMGVAMGNRLAPPFAILFMHDLESRFLATSPEKPSVWFRYIDDIFGVWEHGLERLQQFHQALNQFHPTIKFSLEHTGDLPSIPFLDTNVTVTQDGSVTTELYIKPTHSGILLHYDSAHPKSLKDAIAQSQLQRALRVSNTPSGSTRSVTKMTSMLEKNSYPVNTITRARKRANNTREKRKMDDYDGFLTLPYVSDEISYKIKRAVKKSGLNIRIAQRSGPTLRSILTRSALEPPSCPSRGPCIACQTGLQGCCTTKNVVYKLECILCQESYVGETKRPVRERIMEHRRAALSRNTQNPWGAHFYNKHSGTPTPDLPFTAKIVKRTTDHVERKLSEAIEIAETSPLINTDSGWRLLPTIRKRSLPRRTHAQKTDSRRTTS